MLKNEIAERGWGPALIYHLLLDEQLSQRPTNAPTNQPSTESIVISVTEESSSLTMTVNLHVGTFDAMTDVLLNQCNQDKGREKAIREKMALLKKKTSNNALI
jgi:hypothetical protein